MRGGGAGTGGGVLNWCNKPNLVQGRQGLIGPRKVPAPQEESRQVLRRNADDDLQAAKPPSTPKAAKYGRKAQVLNKTPITSPLLGAGSIKKKRNVNMKKVALMSRDEQEDMKNKVRSIRSFFMTLTDDPKLKRKGGAKAMSNLGDGGDATVPGEQGGTVVDDIVQGGRGETVVCVDENLTKSLDKVSAVKYVSNLYDTQNVRGDKLCVRGEEDGDRGPGTLSDRQSEEAGGGGQGDGDGCVPVYSVVQSVHRVGDENGDSGQRWSIKSARLPRYSGPIDQNQTSGTVSDVDGKFQNKLHAVQSGILLWEGFKQGEMMTENTTNCGLQHKPHCFDRKYATSM